MNKRKIGSRYEEAAAAFLQKQGFRILGKNFRCRQGEIDLVCREGKELVFTEVKYRSDASCGSPFEAVDFLQAGENTAHSPVLSVPLRLSGKYALPF